MRELDVPRRLTVEGPILSSTGVDIKNDPMVMWEIFEKEGFILGALSEMPFWKIILSGKPYVPEESESAAHVMLAPDVGCPINRIEEEEMTVLLQHLLPFVRKGGIVGFNQALVPDKKTSQTWGTMHIHAFRLPEDRFFEKLPGGSRNLQEKVYRRVNRILEWYFLEEDKEDIFKLYQDSIVENDQDQDFPKGGVSFCFKETISPETLSDFLVRLIGAYERFHDSFKHMFMERSIANQEGELYPADQKRFLLKVAELLSDNRKQDIDAPDKLFDMPAYTIVVRKLEGHIQVILSAQIASTRGVFQAIGIDLVRKQRKGAPIEKRLERARQLAERIMKYGDSP